MLPDGELPDSAAVALDPVADPRYRVAQPGTRCRLKFTVDDTHAVSALVRIPDAAQACYVMAHGAGAGMTHAFLETVANGLFARGVATFRYQFPYMEAGAKRPDRPALAQASVRAAVAAARGLAPSLRLFAGGKSFGGRMTSQAQAEAPLDAVDGLIFLGFPLHAAKQPSVARADHLARIEIPMLFLQGTRDTLADLDLLRAVGATLGSRATLSIIDGGDHSFKVTAKALAGRSQAQVLGDLCDTIATWIARVA